MLISKLHKREDLINKVNESAAASKKKININEEDYQDIENNMKPIMPLKPIVSVKNKECKHILLKFNFI